MQRPKQQFTTIDEYITTFPADIRRVLQRMRTTIREAVPDAVEAISYQIPTFKHNGRNLVHFAAFKNHVGMYPVPSGTEAFDRALSPYRRSKGTIRFSLDERIPYGLVRRIAISRMKESLAKTK